MKNLRLLNVNCREATRLASEGMDRRLSLVERVGLRLHLLICAGCRRWRRQALLMRNLLRELDPAMHEDAESGGSPLPEDSRQRIRSALESRP